MNAKEHTEALEYWLDHPPTSNSDRYAMEQAARGCLTHLRAVLTLLPEWEADRKKWWNQADYDAHKYELGVSAALADSVDELSRALGIDPDPA